MDSSVFARLCSLLEERGAPFQVMTHAATFTSEETARVRGTPLESGAKALVCKAGREFQLFVMPASMKLCTRSVRTALAIQRLRFATTDELLDLTGLAPGCVPPFGSLFGLSTWCDELLAAQSRIYFSAGDHTISIGMSFDDYGRIESPRMTRLVRR